MSVREILKMGDARLLRVAQPVVRFDSDELHLLVTDLLDTMRAADGVGLAAPQIGVDSQVLVFGFAQPNARYPDAPLVPATVLVNPTVVALAPEGAAEQAPAQLAEDWEGCLSLPGLCARVPRFTRIRYSGFDQFGAPIERIASDFHARVVQHEYDHLIGKLYPMRVRDFASFGFSELLRPRRGV